MLFQRESGYCEKKVFFDPGKVFLAEKRHRGELFHIYFI